MTRGLPKSLSVAINRRMGHVRLSQYMGNVVTMQAPRAQQVRGATENYEPTESPC
jgi:hypothetical protein